jgi:hypothetical protein
VSASGFVVKQTVWVSRCFRREGTGSSEGYGYSLYPARQVIVPVVTLIAIVAASPSGARRLGSKMEKAIARTACPRPFNEWEAQGIEQARYSYSRKPLGIETEL